jgi:hypothetical protein
MRIISDKFEEKSKTHILCSVTFFKGGTLLVAQLVETLRSKPEGRGFDS